MVTPIDLRPSQASQGGRNPNDRDATINNAWYGFRPWTRKVGDLYEPVNLKSGPNMGKQQISCTLYLELALEGEDETVEISYDIASGYTFSPAVIDPVAPGGIYEREGIGQFLVALSNDTGTDSNTPRPPGTSEFMTFVTELANSPYPGGPGFDVNRLAGEEPIDQVLTGLNLHWIRFTMPKRGDSTYENYIYVPTRINSVKAAVANIPAPPVAGGVAAPTEAVAVDVQGTLQPMFDTFMADPAFPNTMPNFIAYLTIQDKDSAIPNLNEIFKYLGANTDYPVQFGYSIADDKVTINAK